MYKCLIKDFVMANNDYTSSAVIHVRVNITILSDWKVLNLDLASVTKTNNVCTPLHGHILAWSLNILCLSSNRMF